MSKSGDVSRVIGSLRLKGYDIDEHSCEDGDFDDYEVISLLEGVEDLVPVKPTPMNVYTWSFNDKILVNFVTDAEIKLLDAVKPFLTVENLLGTQCDIKIEFERSKVRIEDGSKRKFLETYCCTHPNLIGDLVRQAKVMVDVAATEKQIQRPKVDGKSKLMSMLKKG